MFAVIIRPKPLLSRIKCQVVRVTKDYGNVGGAEAHGKNTTINLTVSKTEKAKTEFLTIMCNKNQKDPFPYNWLF